MITREIKSGILSVGTIDWDRRLFDELVHLPEGTSYNAYLVQGSEKTALIDTAYPAKKAEFLENLEKSGIKTIDYIVSNHAEQDHSGCIPAVLELFPEAKVVTNAKARAILIDSLHIAEDRFIEIKDQETLSLGGRTLEFLLVPWVHWPDTMITYVQEDRIAFTCDFFGSHLATSYLYAVEQARVYDAAKRYYAEIMMPFRKIIQKHLARLDSYAIDIIAPSHGPVYDKPAFILDAYKDWSSDKARFQVLIPYVSMYESTAAMVNHITHRFMEEGVEVRPFNMIETEIGEFAKALVDASSIIVASPVVLGGPHPSMVYAAYLANALKPKLKIASAVGSSGWGGNLPNQIKDMLKNLDVQFVDPVIVKGMPKEQDLKALDALVAEIIRLNKALQ